MLNKGKEEFKINELQFTPESAQDNRRTDHRYVLKSTLLDAIIEGGEVNGHHIMGYTAQNYAYNFTRYFLTTLVKQAFNIHRRIGYEESYYMPVDSPVVTAKSDFEKTMKTAEYIPDNLYYEAIDDLRNLYDHTQDMLEKFNIVDEDNKVTVYRALSSMELAQIADQFRSRTKSTNFRISTNIVLSGQRWNKDEGIGYGHKPITVKLKIDKSKILFYPDFLTTSYGAEEDVCFYQPNSLTYENEVIFVNSDPKGFFSFSESDIYELHETIMEEYIRFVEAKEEKIKAKWTEEELYFRQYDHITRTDILHTTTAKFILLNSEVKEIFNHLPFYLKFMVHKKLRDTGRSPF